MLVVILVGSILLAIIGGVMYEVSNFTVSDIGEVIFGIGAVCAGVTIFAIGVGLMINSDGRVIDEKIAMYEEENAKIEEQIATVVEQYQKYETEIFTEVAPESSMTLVALYPELKSDTLVQSQIEVYTANNEKIKELRSKEISYRNWLWWLYFGGK